MGIQTGTYSSNLALSQAHLANWKRCNQRHKTMVTKHFWKLSINIWLVSIDTYKFKSLIENKFHEGGMIFMDFYYLAFLWGMETVHEDDTVQLAYIWFKRASSSLLILSLTHIQHNLLPIAVDYSLKSLIK